MLQHAILTLMRCSLPAASRQMLQLQVPHSHAVCLKDANPSMIAFKSFLMPALEPFDGVHHDVQGDVSVQPCQDLRSCGLRSPIGMFHPEALQDWGIAMHGTWSFCLRNNLHNVICSVQNFLKTFCCIRCASVSGADFVFMHRA